MLAQIAQGYIQNSTTKLATIFDQHLKLKTVQHKPQHAVRTNTLHVQQTTKFLPLGVCRTYQLCKKWLSNIGFKVV